MNKIFWGFFLVLTFIVTLPVSWWALAKADFGYGFLYDQINISEHIERYAPRNSQGKKHFELTTKEQRAALFHGVIEAIQTQGKGLDELSYVDKPKQQNIKLFTSAEVTHLQDVANLLDKLKIPLLISLVVWISFIIILWQRKISIASSKQLLFSTLLILLIVGAILALGPEAIFNQLHIWVFPNNHQWFFYYEESLMSTMMKAPDLFAYIAAMWALLSIVLTVMVIAFLRRFLKR